MEENKLLGSYSYYERYAYSNVRIDKYGEFGLLAEDFSCGTAELSCDGEIGDESQPVNVIVKGTKIGQIPESRLQGMWHEFIKAGKKVTALVDTFDGVPKMTLSYKDFSASDYDYLIAIGTEHVTTELQVLDESFLEINLIREKDEFSFIEMDYERDRYAVMDCDESVLLFPAALNDVLSEESTYRVFVKELTKDGNGKYRIMADIVFSKPCETVVFSSGKLAAVVKQTEKNSNQTNEYTIEIYRVSTALPPGLVGLQPVNIIVDGKAAGSVKIGETLKLKLPKGNHKFDFEHSLYHKHLELNVNEDNHIDLTYGVNGLSFEVLRKNDSTGTHEKVGESKKSYTGTILIVIVVAIALAGYFWLKTL